MGNLKTLRNHFNLERINAVNTKRSKLLETKLRAIDSPGTYESTCRPNQDLLGRGKNTILKKECIFCKKNKYKKKVFEKSIQCLEFCTVDSIKKAARLKNDFMC